jgi:hypothetical protein
MKQGIFSIHTITEEGAKRNPEKFVTGQMCQEPRNLQNKNDFQCINLRL